MSPPSTESCLFEIILAPLSLGGEVLGMSLSSGITTPGIKRDPRGLLDVDRLDGDLDFDFSREGDFLFFFVFPARS